MSWTQAMVVAGEATLDARGLVPLETARARVRRVIQDSPRGSAA